MENTQEILDKLNLDKRSANFILSNETLCKRILKENPIRLSEFLDKHEISAHYINGLVKKNIVSSFSNSPNKGSATFIFENELESYIKKYNYNTNYLFSIVEKTVNLFLLNIKNTIEEREYYILKSILIDNKSREEVSQELKISHERVRQVFEKAYHKIISSNRINNEYNKIKDKHDDLKLEYHKLLRLNNNLLLKSSELNNNEYKRLKEIQLIDVDISVRALNSLQYANIKTLGDLSLTSRKTLMKYRNFGIKTLTEVESLLKEYNLKLKD